MLNKRENSLKLEKEFEDSIISFHYRMINEFRNRAKEFGFPFSQLEVLHYVVEKVNPTMKEIAEHLQIKPPSVTSIVEMLCKKKLLKRVISKKDKRVVRITFTSKIWEFFNSIKDKKISILKDIFSELNSKDKKELTRIINVLNKK
jgi:DNA-binding MarR family transcriptional regulator